MWATWILYAILVDLTDDVAEALNRPFTDISMEMVYRGLYYFAQAYRRGQATGPIILLACHAKLLGIIKRRRTRWADKLPDLAYPPCLSVRATTSAHNCPINDSMHLTILGKP